MGIKKLRSWKRRFWCARFHVLVKNKLCIWESAPAYVSVSGEILPGKDFQIWSMKCGKCEQ